MPICQRGVIFNGIKDEEERKEYIMTNTEIVNFLREASIKASTQRLAIYSYLDKYRNHPTVDTIYNDLIGDYPMLSKTTVYNTLKLFIEKGVVQGVIIEDGEMRYDANITLHAHFKCKKCGSIHDIFMSGLQERCKFEGKFKVDEIHLNYRGLCDKCCGE